MTWVMDHGPELFFLAPAQTSMMTPAGSATHVTELLTARHCGARCCIQRGSCGTRIGHSPLPLSRIFSLVSIHSFSFIPFHCIPFIHLIIIKSLSASDTRIVRDQLIYQSLQVDSCHLHPRPSPHHPFSRSHPPHRSRVRSKKESLGIGPLRFETVIEVREGSMPFHARIPSIHHKLSS